MEQDAQQKEQLSQKLWLLGYLPQFEAKCYTPLGIEEQRSEMTDVDVLGFRMNDFFRPEKVAVDCKTGKSSAINRAIWLHGLMESLGVDAGFVISKKEVPIDHRQASQPWHISIVKESEIDTFFRLTAGVQRIDLKCLQKDVWARFRRDLPNPSKLAPLLDYRDFFFWGDRGSRSLRYILMETRGAHEFLDPKQKLHHVLVADSIALFCVSLLQVVSSILPITLVTDDKDALDNLLKAHVYGGREVYSYMDRMRAMLVSFSRMNDAATFVASASDSLGLPEWERFLSLVRAAMEFPQRLAPSARLLRVIAMDRIMSDNKVDLATALPELDVKAVQMAADVVAYFCEAGNLDYAFVDRIRGECDAVLLALAEQRSHL
jgi:hypothetical protein